MGRGWTIPRVASSNIARSTKDDEAERVSAPDSNPGGLVRDDLRLVRHPPWRMNLPGRRHPLEAGWSVTGCVSNTSFSAIISPRWLFL